MKRRKRRGTPRPNAGRPASAGEPRNVQVMVRATPEERESWEARARADGVSVSEWIRRTLAANL